MVKFIDLREQDTGYLFAFWDTVCDRFLWVGEEQAWDSIADLTECTNVYCDKDRLPRLLRLLPKWVPENDQS